MTWIRYARRFGIAVAAAVLTLGCGNDGPSENTGSIQVTIGSPSLSVAQGGTGSVTVTLTRSGGFDGAVSLAISGLPTGVTASIVPAELTGATLTATVNLTVASTVALGTLTATVTATAVGVTPATATYELNVTPQPDFTLSVSPAALTIVAGADNEATVGIARSSFSGAVAVSLPQPPAGITALFNPTPATGDGAAVSVSVAPGVAPGVYPLTIQGSSTGPGTRTTSLTVTVPPPPAGGNVQYEFCDPAEAPVFVGYQDGSGPWQAVTGATSAGTTRYTLNLTQSRGGVMFVYPPAASVVAGIARVMSRQTTASPPSGIRTAALLEEAYVTQVLYGTRLELAQDGAGSCALTQPTKTITGTVGGVALNAYGKVSVGGAEAIVDAAASGNPIAFVGVASGPVDVVGSRTVPGNAPNKTFVLRNLSIANGGSLPTLIDFNGATAAAPASASATITGGGGDKLEVFVDLVTTNGVGGFWSDMSPSTVALRPWGGLATMLPGDLHSLVVFATPQGNQTDFRVALRHVGAVSDQSIAMGPTITAPATSQVVGGAYPRFRFQGVLPADYRGVSIDVLGVGGSGNTFSIIATSNWFLEEQGNPWAYDFTMPDVSGLLGFPLASRLTAGANDLSVSGWNFTGTGVFDVRPVLGAEFKAAVRGTILVVP